MVDQKTSELLDRAQRRLKTESFTVFMERALRWHEPSQLNAAVRQLKAAAYAEAFKNQGILEPFVIPFCNHVLGFVATDGPYENVRRLAARQQKNIVDIHDPHKGSRRSHRRKEES